MTEVNINQGKNNNKSDKSRFFHLVENLLSTLSSRSQEIIKKRYGLVDGEGETLEKIGSDYGITRERVRQIIFDAIKNVAKRIEEPEFKEAQDYLIFTIEKNNGIIKEKKIVEEFNLDGSREANALKFFASCSPKIKVIEEKNVIEKSWVIDPEIRNDIKRVAEEAEELLNKENKLLNNEEIAEKLVASLEKVTESQILSYLDVLMKIRKNKFGKWGMAGWVEVSPKGTRDKIYLVLKEENKPLHFTEIAQLIDKYNLGKRKAHPQTVHNELIKDNRFVLIGRGIYAMREWGYSQGTIKDVLKNILENSKEPLSKEEILKKVFKVRKVKKATVMINLNNNEIFERHNDSYLLKK